MIKNIKKMREKHNLTQEELAKLSGVSRGTILALENDSQKTTTTKTLLKIAKALNTTVENIFIGENDEIEMQKMIAVIHSDRSITLEPTE